MRTLTNILCQSIYQDCYSQKPVEKSKAKYKLNGTDDDKEGEGDGVDKSLGVDWNQSLMSKSEAMRRGSHLT